MWPRTRYKNRPAIIFKNMRLTFAQMDARINRLSNGLLSLGLTIGSKVAVLLNNGVESATCLLAIPRACLTYISLNARHSPQEHANSLNNAETDAVIIGEEFSEIIRPVLPSVEKAKMTL